MGMLDNTYSVNQAAEILGVTPGQVYAALRKDMHVPPWEHRLPGAWRPNGMKYVAGTRSRQWITGASNTGNRWMRGSTSRSRDAWQVTSR